MPLIRPWGHKIRAARMEDGRLGVDQAVKDFAEEGGMPSRLEDVGLYEHRRRGTQDRTTQIPTQIVRAQSCNSLCYPAESERPDG